MPNEENEVEVQVEVPSQDRTDVSPLIEAVRVLQKAEDLLDGSKQPLVDRANTLLLIAREYRAIYDTIQ